jgi:hypothetical protein
MTVLMENPLPIAVGGGLLALVAVLVFLSRRNLASLLALAGILGFTVLLLIVESLVETDREQVESAIDGVLDAIEANDVAAVVGAVDPAATKIRSDIEALMPLVKWTLANAGSMEVTVNAADEPLTATSRFRAFLNGVHQRSGNAVPYMNQQVDVDWVKRGEQWLLTGYTAYYDGQPIDAVSSAAGIRPVPTR